MDAYISPPKAGIYFASGRERQGASTANYKYVPMKGEFYPDYQKGGLDTVPPSLDRPVSWACATPLLVRQDELGNLVMNTW